ncbi:MAG: DUF1330 domain-containing protein [Gammaproteobacteria bacterium]
MVAYFISDADIEDAAGYKEYTTKVPVLIEKYGGEYLVRGGEFEVHEGDWRPHRLVIFRFPDREAIRAMIKDPAYLELKRIRQRTAKTCLVAVDGLA